MPNELQRPDDAENGGRQMFTTRRRFLLAGALAGGGVMGLAEALDDDGELGNLWAGFAALSQEYNVAGNLWVGPDSTKSNVSADSGRIFMATDTQIDYYGDGGTWQAMGVGTPANPTPASYFQSVTAEDVNDTFWALAHDGAKGGEKLQNAIDAAASNVGSAAVIVSGEPDDLSGLSGADRNRGWLIDREIQHKDDVYIYCLGDPYLFLEAGVDGVMIENADHTGGNSNLKLLGGTWDCNAANNQSPSDPNNGFLLYYPVDEVEISPDKVQDYGSAIYAIQIGNGNDIHVGRVEYDGDKDAVHLHGPIDGFHIEEQYGTAGDDMVALATADYPSAEISTGEIKNGRIESIRVTGGDAACLSIHGKSDDSDYIENVTIGDISTNHESNPMVRFRTDSNISGDGKVLTRNIKFESVTASDISGFDSIISISGDSHDLIDLRSVALDNITSTTSVIKLDGPTDADLDVEVVNIQNCDINNLVLDRVGANIRVTGGRWTQDSTFRVMRSDAAVTTDLDVIGLTVVGVSGNQPTILSPTSGGTVNAKLSHVTVESGSGVANLSGGSTATVEMTNVTLKDGTGRAFDVDDDLTLIMSNCRFMGMDNNPFFLADGASIDIESENLDTDFSGTLFQTATATFTIRADGRNIQVDVDDVTPSADDRVHNTDSSKDFGTGVVYSPDGSTWTREAVVTESANAETPQGSYGDGQLVDFTDSGDGSGTGLYVIDSSGSPQGPI